MADQASPTKPSSALALLKARLAQRNLPMPMPGLVKKREAMAPIYDALNEITQAGVIFQFDQDEFGPLATYDDGAGAGRQALLAITLYDLDMKSRKAIKLEHLYGDWASEGYRKPGEYWGEAAKVVRKGHLSLLTARDKMGGRSYANWKKTMRDPVYFKDAQEAIEWLVGQLAPCVKTAPGLEPISELEV